MPRNIEIKAKVHNVNHLRLLIEKIAGTPAQLIFQEDTYFHSSSGRLKLRIYTPERGELIYYQRSNQEGPKESNYIISTTSEPRSLKEVLTSAYGVRGVILKQRELYRVGQATIHLDRVEGLGEFLELEFVMQNGQTDAEGMETLEHLMDKLGIEGKDLINCAYIDLLTGYYPTDLNGH
jgi:predicted adenylyl cyclase CyaB